ncbi:PIG-L domain-containing protein [Sphingobium lactosutens]|uniref:PIG-L deacetylase family protein n=1 Tax=Sphingobium lactosutens TaxID=522773 RepID=UPI0015BC7406|nr:PIG-L deacetylase family protein [Sphingobium lactosutens]NWK98776.1 PIG-L domain-containing protein [Sphingobium lactosutens]
MSDRMIDSGVTLVIAPHPDDEVLGCGGVMARLADAGRDVHVAIVTRGRAPRYSQEGADRVRHEALAAHELLGVARTHFLDQPAAELDQVPHADLNGAMGQLFEEVKPDTVFLPFLGDIHLDHQLIFRSAMVAARPRSWHYPLRLYAYETLSETNWAAPQIEPGFAPNIFIDIHETLERKLAAFACFQSQCGIFPNERSPEALRALAMLRGATVHRYAAEAFMLIREVI